MRLQTDYRIHQQTLIVDLGQKRRVLSSAPYRGGLVVSRYVLNHQVAANPPGAGRENRTWPDPARYLGRLAVRLGLGKESVALMTAVPLEHLVVAREQDEDLWVEAFVTVGLSNAVRAGEALTHCAPQASERERRTAGGVPGSPGTINIILVTNGCLTGAAMVGALHVATESKTACLLEHRVPTWSGRPGATGTGTDALVLAGGGGPALRYAGTHTRLGAMVGRVVGRAVHGGLLRWQRWKECWLGDGC